MSNVQQQTGIRAIPARHAPTVSYIGRNKLIGILAHRRGAAFVSVETEYDMLETDARGQLKKMKKRGNPFLGGGLRKIAKTLVLVTFDYAKAVERRTDGEETAKGGNWQQAVVWNKHLTPLTIHKADIKTKPKENAEPRDDGSYRLADLEAVLDFAGNVQITTMKPRFYLRCEFRGSESRYVDGQGETVAAEDVKPYLKAQGKPGAVDHHTVNMSNVKRLTIDHTAYVVR